MQVGSDQSPSGHLTWSRDRRRSVLLEGPLIGSDPGSSRNGLMRKDCGRLPGPSDLSLSLSFPLT